MFDVVICGAGPAGTTAATVLARGGARVLLLDRARFPRDKLCGDTVNPGALAALRRLDLAAGFERGALEIRGMIVSGEAEVAVRGEYGAGIYGLSVTRRVFDAALLEAASAAGVRVEEGAVARRPLLDSSGDSPRARGIIVAGRDGADVRIPAPLVIAADGRRSRLATAAGLLRHPGRPRRWAVGAYFEGVAGLSAFGEMHIRRDHYVGVAPVPGGLANVCFVSEVRRGLDDPAAALLQSIGAHADLRQRFAGATMVSPAVSMGPLAVDAAACGIAGLLLAGDASGFIDPMTGDGLRFAIVGGELAGRAALAALADGRAAHRRLARWRRRAFARKHAFNRALRAIVAAPAAVSAASAAARVAPWTVSRLIAVAGDVHG